MYGRVMQGHNITDFEEREDRNWIGEEGLYIACVVMEVLYIASGVDEPSAFNAMVEDAGQRQNIPSRRVFSATQSATMITRYKNYLHCWYQLQPGAFLTLLFPDKHLQHGQKGHVMHFKSRLSTRLNAWIGRRVRLAS